MKTKWKIAIPWLLAIPTISMSTAWAGGAIGKPTLSRESKECIECHKKDNPGLY